MVEQDHGGASGGEAARDSLHPLGDVAVCVLAESARGEGFAHRVDDDEGAFCGGVGYLVGHHAAFDVDLGGDVDQSGEDLVDGEAEGAES